MIVSYYYKRCPSSNVQYLIFKLNDEVRFSNDKKIIFFISLLLIIGALGYVTYGQKEVFQTVPWTDSMKFNNVSEVKMDQDNHFYLVDQSLKRLTKIDADETYQFHINMNDRERRDSLFLAKDVVIDENGYIYILNLVLGSQGIFLEAEEIVQYSPQGKFKQVIYENKYDLSEKVTRPGRLHELNYHQGFLYFYEMNENDIVEEQDIVLHKLDKDSGNIEEVLQITLPEETFISSITGIELGRIYYTTKRAEIYHIDTEGKSNLLYSSSSSGLDESYPVSLGNDFLQNVYFIDIGREEINRLDSPLQGHQTVDQIVTNSDLKEQGYDFPLKSTKSIQVNQDDSILIGVKNYIVHLDPQNGEIFQAISEAKYKTTDILFRLLIWLMALLIILLFLYTIKLLYFDIMRHRTSIILKQIMIFIPVIVMSLVLVSGVVYYHFINEFDLEVKNKLKLLAHSGAEIVDKERMERINKPEDFMNDDYRYIDERNHNMLKGNKDLDADALYSVIYSVDDNKQVHILMLYNTSSGTYFPTDYIKDDYDLVIDEGHIITRESQEVTGEWLYALGPIYNAEGKLIGMQEVGMTLHNFNESKNQIFRNVGQVILILIPIIALIFLFMTYYMLSSIRKLRKSVIEIAKGNWDTTVEIDTGDEVAELGNQFNVMAKQIGKYVLEMKQISQSYYRFVPEQFLNYLGKNGILEVRLGDQIEEEMVVLVSNIRSFNSISKEMTPKGSFDYINSFYEVVGPIIRQHDGMINTYLSAGIMALFPKKPEHALKNAIEMRRTLRNLNEAQVDKGNVAKTEMDIGIGIHKGRLMLGIVGEKERMEGNVISDDVNISILLEKHTETVGASILVSEVVYETIPSFERFQHRCLGLVQFPEIKEPITLYDVFEGDPEPLRKNKGVTKEWFEKGVKYYQEGRFFDARTAFLEVIKKNEMDQAAKLYFALSDEYFQRGASTEWNGTLEL